MTGRPARVLRLGSRRSLLATTQAEGVARSLREAGHEVHLVGVTTEGDLRGGSGTESALGTGVFVSTLRAALARGEIDLAVHSLKDVPVEGTTADTLATDSLATEVPTVIAAVPRREDPRDVLVARDGLTLGELPAGALIGTGSPRRAAQLAALGLGLAPGPVRGNVDTRLALVTDGQVDAVVLARAGLARLGRLEVVTETLDPIQVLPAAGQGALGVECRSDDVALRELLSGLDDPDSRACVVAERAVLAGLQAGCSAPVGVLAEVVEGDDGPELSVRAVVAAPDGAETLRRSVVGPLGDPAGLGRRLAALLLEDGAAEIASLGRGYPGSAPAAPIISGTTSASSTSARTTPPSTTAGSTTQHRLQHGIPQHQPAYANLPEATP
jgi:hydroxymethylbilane synthase